MECRAACDDRVHELHHRHVFPMHAIEAFFGFPYNLSQFLRNLPPCQLNVLVLCSGVHQLDQLSNAYLFDLRQTLTVLQHDYSCVCTHLRVHNLAV